MESTLTKKNKNNTTEPSETVECFFQYQRRHSRVGRDKHRVVRNRYVAYLWRRFYWFWKPLEAQGQGKAQIGQSFHGQIRRIKKKENSASPTFLHAAVVTPYLQQLLLCHLWMLRKRKEKRVSMLASHFWVHMGCVLLIQRIPFIVRKTNEKWREACMEWSKALCWMMYSANFTFPFCFCLSMVAILFFIRHPITCFVYTRMTVQSLLWTNSDAWQLF